MSAVPDINSYALKSRNVAVKTRKTFSVQPSTGSGTYGGKTGRKDVSFSIPASHMMEPRGVYLKFKAKLQVGATATGISTPFAAFLDGSAASVIERLTIRSGSGEIIEDISDVDQLALFNLRAKPESYRYEEGRQLMGFCPKIDEDLDADVVDGTGDSEGHAVLQATAVAASSTISRDFEWCIPMCMISSLFNSDKAWPLKYFARGGGAALVVDFKLRDAAHAMTVVKAGNAEVDELDPAGDKTNYELSAVELVSEELTPTAVYDQALRESISDAGADGLKLFYRNTSGFSSTVSAGTTVYTQSIPLYEFSVQSLVSWFKKQVTPAFDKHNVSKWACAGVTKASSSFGSYEQPVGGISYENPLTQASAQRKNNARGKIELDKVCGKVCGESSTGFKKWEVSAEVKNQTTGAVTTIVDNAYHRCYAFNYDSIDNMLQDPSKQISGVDNRSSSLPAVIRFEKEGGRDGFSADPYQVFTYMMSDRLLSVSETGLRSGVTA